MERANLNQRERGEDMKKLIDILVNNGYEVICDSPRRASSRSVPIVNQRKKDNLILFSREEESSPIADISFRRRRDILDTLAMNKMIDLANTIPGVTVTYSEGRRKEEAELTRCQKPSRNIALPAKYKF